MASSITKHSKYIFFPIYTELGSIHCLLLFHRFFDVLYAERVKSKAEKKDFFEKFYLFTYIVFPSFFLFLNFKKKEIFDKTSTYFGNIIIQYFLEYQELIQELFPKKNKMRLNSQNSREREREKKIDLCIVAYCLFNWIFVVFFVVSCWMIQEWKKNIDSIMMMIMIMAISTAINNTGNENSEKPNQQFQ